MTDKLAVITGASSGIGYNLAKVFAENGYDLVVGAEDAGIHQAAANLAMLRVEVTPLQVDLATFAGCVAFWGGVEALGRKVDAVALNAGLGCGGLFADTDLEREIALVRVNVESTVHLAKYAVRKLVAQRDGKILLVSSILAELVAPKQAVYGASKAFGLSFAKSLRHELKGTGVSVTALQPGPVDTNIFARAGLEGTKVGTEGKKENDPYEVAKQGFAALMKGRKHVYAASLKAKVEGSVLSTLPDALVAKVAEKLIDRADG